MTQLPTTACFGQPVPSRTSPLGADAGWQGTTARQQRSWLSFYPIFCAQLGILGGRFGIPASHEEPHPDYEYLSAVGSMTRKLIMFTLYLEIIGSSRARDIPVGKPSFLAVYVPSEPPAYRVQAANTHKPWQ